MNPQLFESTFQSGNFWIPYESGNRVDAKSGYFVIHWRHKIEPSSLPWIFKTVRAKKNIRIRVDGQIRGVIWIRKLWTWRFKEIAYVASVSVWFRSKEIPRKGTFGFDRARNVTRAKKWKRGEEAGKSRGLSASVSFLSSQPPPRSFTCATFLAVFDSRSSFFSPKPYRNACYAG